MVNELNCSWWGRTESSMLQQLEFDMYLHQLPGGPEKVLSTALNPLCRHPFTLLPRTHHCAAALLTNTPTPSSIYTRPLSTLTPTLSTLTAQLDALSPALVTQQIS